MKETPRLNKTDLFDEKIDKIEMPSAQIRAIAYETIERRYLNNLLVLVFADGSMSEVLEMMHKVYKAVEVDMNFNEQVEAIFIALNELSARKRNFPLAVILSVRNNTFSLPNEFMNVERFSTLWLTQLSCSEFLLIVASKEL
ncbi:hypothetical protein TNCV_629881 [Trichonephila clavipes]|nr:hypothetical protein TNCV_629881 [Trichonephila clavipes]